MVLWYSEIRAWYGFGCLGAAAVVAFYPLVVRWLGGEPRDHGGSQVVIVGALSATLALVGLSLLFAPLERTTRLRFERDNRVSTLRAVTAGTGVGWVVIGLLEQYWFETFHLTPRALEIPLHGLGIAVAVAVWHPTQKRILKSYYRTARLYRRAPDR